MAIVAADTTGERADRIESLLSARLFVEPQLADDRITFVSNLSGHLSLYAMDATGGVPEPLLPPQMALQNPELVGGELFHVLPALRQILVMIDTDGDENYVPHMIPLDGGFPVPLADEPFSGGRSHLVHVDDDAEIAYFAVESREEASITAVRVHLPTRAADELWQSSYGAFVAAWTPDHSRVVLMDGYTMGDTVLYEIDEGGTRTMLYGTPIDERDPQAQQPLAGFRGGYGTASGAGVLLASTLHDDTGSLAYLDLSRSGDVDPVAIDGLTHQGSGELEELDHLEGDRYTLTYNIDGCSWVYAGTFDEAARSFSVERVLVGEGELAGGVLHGVHYDVGSGRFVASFCAATSPTQLHLLAADDAPSTTLTRERALGPGAGAAVTGRGCIVRVARRAARVGSALPPVVRARIRGCAAARLLRPRRAPEPGTAQLRVVLDAAHPDPHARGVRRVRPECARIDRLRARLREACRPRLGWAGPPRPRPRHDRGAPAPRTGGYVAGRCGGALVRRLHDPDARRTTPRALARSRRHVRPVRPDPEADRDFITERSPKTHIESISCPLPVVQGRNDPRVVERESRDVVERLRGLGRDVDYLVFEDEGHDVLKLANRVRCYDAIVAFFAQHLS